MELVGRQVASFPFPFLRQTPTQRCAFQGCNLQGGVGESAKKAFSDGRRTDVGVSNSRLSLFLGWALLTRR